MLRPKAMLFTAVVLLAAAPAAMGQTRADSCPAPSALSFAPPSYVDTTRAGGEPLVATHPSGRIIYSAHAGTTHFFTPAAANPGTAAFAENYTGQTYVWTSDDSGKTWVFRPRSLPSEGAPLAGFSDPEIAIDSAGDVIYSEINLSNIAVSKSSDAASTFTLQNLLGALLTDRQWMEADRKDELYFVGNASGGGTGTLPLGSRGHFIAKSVDGGRTFTQDVADSKGGMGLGDIRVDKRTGTVYEAHYDGTALSMAAFRDARNGTLTVTDTNLVAKGVKMLGHWPAFNLDPDGNLYITWDESGTGDRDAGIWYSRSTDSGITWAVPTRVDPDNKTDIWPWIAVGDAGRVGVMWLEADHRLPNENAQTSGTYGWRVMGAVTTNALGCGASATPGFSVATATPDPVHTGTICQGGTQCQVELIDRRLGDYFSADVDGHGYMYAGYADTQVAGSVALPGFVRQSGGPLLRAAAEQKPTQVTVPTRPHGGASGGLAATGLTPWWPLLAGLCLLGAWLARRSRPTGAA